MVNKFNLKNFKRGIEEIIKEEELKKALSNSQKLRIYLGVDPSAPEIHLGHAICLRKLREFQKMGHKVIFLIGDFTGMIGDPTGKLSVRTPLTREQVLENAKTYKKQVSFFLNFSGENPAEIAFNSQWNDKLTFKELIDLASKFTVQQFIERDMFENRLKENKPIFLHEFLYPLIQGYDAVMLDADVQIGGSDQKFNMLISRQMVKEFKNKPHIVITAPLLEGTDGRKMSKSYNNTINITDNPQDMFGKVMSLKDELILKYFYLATELSEIEIQKIEKQLQTGLNPKEAKMKLAFEIVKIYHGETLAKKAMAEFERVFSQKKAPLDIPEISLPPKPIKLIDLLLELKMIKSKAEGKRIIEQGGLDINNQKITDKDFVIKPYSGMIIKLGKRKWLKIK